MYADFDFYRGLYGPDSITKAEYDRLGWEAARLIDKHTSGVDNVRKLRVAFPVDEEAAEAVRRCECALVNLLQRIGAAERAGEASAQVNGAAVSGPVSSVSSGAESISYGKASGAVSKAAESVRDRSALLDFTVRDMLSGLQDANGVNLLYMGVYPCVL